MVPFQWCAASETSGLLFTELWISQEGVETEAERKARKLAKKAEKAAKKVAVKKEK